MLPFASTPTAVRRACERLRESGLCRIVRAVDSIHDVFSRLAIAIDVPHPNPEGLPPSIELECRIAHPYPFGEIELIPKGEDVRGFPHQATDGGKLCLPSAQDAPWDETRLLQYVQWTKEWLVDASNGQLLKVGDPYELPDFRHSKLPDPTLQDVPPILFEESSGTFPLWHGIVGQVGSVLLANCKSANAVAAERWFAAEKSCIRTASFSPAFLRNSNHFTGQWALLPTLTFVRARPPRTYEELSMLFRASNISLGRVLRRAWALGSSSPRGGVVLLGCPIPSIVGGPATEIHWQPVLVPTKDMTRRAYRGRGKRDEGLLWRVATETIFTAKQLITYGQSTNVAAERQYARGPAPTFIGKQAIALVGAGAIGSVVAEMLARAGVSPLSLFDGDRLEFGNLCRHTLSGSDVGHRKAYALAARLSSANPLSVIEAFSEDIPLLGDPGDAPSLALSNASTLIDCSTDHGAFLWMSNYSRQNSKRLASLFINRNATLLTLVLSGRNIGAEKVFTQLNRTVVAGATSINPVEYLGTNAAAAPLVPGPGCWHPTFPGRNNHIALLVTAAIDYLYAWLQEPYHCDGRAVVLRRRDASPIIEAAFDRKCR